MNRHVQDKHMPRLGCPTPSCNWTAPAGRKSALKQHMLQLHPLLGNQSVTVSDEELRQRCAAFKKEIEGEEKSKKRKEFEEKWRQDVEKQKKKAEEERKKRPKIDWPEDLEVKGYHPAPGNVEDSDEEEDPLPGTSCNDKDKEVAIEDELGESPQYEICEMADIKIDGIPLLQVPSETNITIDVAQDPSSPSPSPMQLTTAEVTPVVSAPTKRDAACQAGLLPMGEEVAEGLPKGIVEIPLNAPRYRLVERRKLSEREGDRYDQWHKDPRLFFLGAPSTYKREWPFQVLQEARRQALYHPGIRCARTLPHGAGYIERVESMEYPDGRIYRLSAFWHEDRKVTDRSSVGTQYEPAEE